jgi:transposase InsO family protein
VSRSGFYRWKKRPISKRDLSNDKLLFYISQIHTESNKTHGSPRMTEFLRAKGIKCNHKRVEKLMREKGVYAKTKRKFKITTHSKHNRPIAKNLIKMDFTASEPNKVWTSDITYIWTPSV